ncbi:thioredoxin domain-containing protein [Pendulispora rubella]|uniref:Thioredoxin domain-containing protein n=1 Tax=Pendulispora rubella TaxID=2741070 RepID=A0ABZ2L337_9BACT
MRKTSSLAYVLLLVLPVLVGLTVSALLLVDYLRPAPLFCESGGGCDRIRQTDYSSFLGVPLPAFGLLGYLALGALTFFVRGPVARRVEVALAGISGLIGAGLLLLQVKLATFCPYCTIVDTCSLLVFAGSVLRLRHETDPPAALVPRLLGGVAMAGAVAVPFFIGRSVSTLPPVIAAEIEKTPQGKVTVVDFVDFECPFCRVTHEAFSPVLASHASQIRVVRKQVPLTRIHPNALDAARAACCGEQLGKGEEMASALFQTEDLTAAGCEKLALSLGLDLGAYRSCIGDPKVDERIQKETAEFRASKSRGLPTIYIGEHKLEGMQGAAELESTMARALADQS